MRGAEIARKPPNWWELQKKGDFAAFCGVPYPSSEAVKVCAAALIGRIFKIFLQKKSDSVDQSVENAYRASMSLAI
jgi:hypothetical protein